MKFLLPEKLNSPKHRAFYDLMLVVNSLSLEGYGPCKLVKIYFAYETWVGVYTFPHIIN